MTILFFKHEKKRELILVLKLIYRGQLFAQPLSMNNLIIVSKCLRVTKINTVESLAEFHFKGVFAGKDVRRVLLFFNNESKVYLGNEYLIFAELVAYEEKKLRGRIVKVKNLDECLDKS